jgi:hypothetical protein
VQRFVPQSDLLGLNPIWTTGFVVGNAAYMTYDTMYAIDSSFYVRPQMAEEYERSDDGLQWAIRLPDPARASMTASRCAKSSNLAAPALAAAINDLNMADSPLLSGQRRHAAILAPLDYLRLGETS